MIISETPVSGSKYPRAKRVIIDNKLGVTPTATFINELVYVLDGDVVSKDYSATSTAGIAMDAQVPIRDPSDDTIVTTQAYGDVLTQVYALLYSIHRHIGV